MQLRRVARARGTNDAFAVAATSRRMSAHKPIVLLINMHAPSPADLEKEDGDSSSQGLETSPKRGRTCSPRKEKIKLLKGWGSRPSIDVAKNL